MDHTISNVSELEHALSTLKMQKSSSQHGESDSVGMHPPLPEDSNKYISVAKQSSKDRMKTDQLSSNKLLYNLSGLQTATNTKLDLLTDAVNRMSHMVQIMYEENVKQTELLATIARNTAGSRSHTPNSIDRKQRPGISTSSVKDYGFIDGVGVMTELLYRLLKQVEIKIESAGRRYRSTRVLKSNMLSKAISIACKSQFRQTSGIEDASPIKIPDNKDSTMVSLASKIGSMNGYSPILDSAALRDLFTNSEFRVVSTIFQNIMERLKIIRIMLPFYEADIINALVFPYFDKDGGLLCDWNTLQPRLETPEEAAVMMSSITIQGNIGKMVAKGASIKSAVRASIKEKEK